MEKYPKKSICYQKPKTMTYQICCPAHLLATSFSGDDNNATESFGEEGALPEFEW